MMEVSTIKVPLVKNIPKMTPTIIKTTITIILISLICLVSIIDIKRLFNVFPVT